MQESTIVIKGRKKALQEAYRRSLTSVHDYYCITGDELTKSYKPFIPLLHTRISQRAGSTQIITNIEKETIPAVKELTEAGAQGCTCSLWKRHQKGGSTKDNTTSKESFYVEADKVRIAQVISNLLNNAMKFTQEGTITISCNRMNYGNEKRSAMFCMKDTGVGIHPEIYPKLFSKFASHSDGGIGLGYFYAKT